MPPQSVDLDMSNNERGENCERTKMAAVTNETVCFHYDSWQCRPTKDVVNINILFITSAAA